MSQVAHTRQLSLQLSLAAITISGSDARAFLQSQLTADVETIREGQLQAAAWCSPNGRVDVVVLVSLGQLKATLILPETLAETVFKRARMYSIGRQIDIAYGPEVRGCQAAVAGDDALWLSLALDQTRRLMIAPRQAANTPENNAWPLPVDWLRADIECGMPWILPETSGMFLPQMIGLEALGGLSYKKGCFPGQEVIARVHYRGRVTRRLTRFRLQTDRPPPPGTTFELADNQACVLYAVSSADAEGTSDGLAVVAADAAIDNEIRIADDAGMLVSG